MSVSSCKQSKEAFPSEASSEFYNAKRFIFTMATALVTKILRTIGNRF